MKTPEPVIMNHSLCLANRIIQLQEIVLDILAIVTIKESQSLKSGNISIVTELFQEYIQTKRYFPLLFDKYFGQLSIDANDCRIRCSFLNNIM